MEINNIEKELEESKTKLNNYLIDHKQDLIATDKYNKMLYEMIDKRNNKIYINEIMGRLNELKELYEFKRILEMILVQREMKRNKFTREELEKILSEVIQKNKENHL